jgi:hypothetical protein
MWTGGFLLWAWHLKGWRHGAALFGMLLAWLTVWASASRTAFVAGVIIAVFSGVAVFELQRQRDRRNAIRTVALLTVVLASILVALSAANLTSVGPLRRLLLMVPSASPGALRAAAWEELWNRNRYGTAATEMIRAFPWFGVGPGSFQTMLPEFSRLAGGPLTPDNAQNWYRHQVAELGMVGTAPIVAWFALFAALLVHRPRDRPPAAWVARGILVAFAAISFVGMPGQDIFVAITFWTMAAWSVRLIGAPVDQRVPAVGLGAVVAVVVLFAAGTVHAAVTELRVPTRAKRVGWPYAYGFHASQSLEGAPARWTGRHAVAVIEAPTRWIQITARVDHRLVGLDASTVALSQAPTRPVDIKIWCDGELVIDRHIENTAPVTAVVPIAGDDRWVWLETWASRGLRPAELGLVDDERELGMLVQWSFVEHPGAH